MRSARTDRPTNDAEELGTHRRRVALREISRYLWHRLRVAPPFLRAFLALTALTFILTGCATGNAQDALRGQQRDATRADVLPKLQETAVARLFAATPVPGPTRTPIPTLEQLVLTVGTNPDGSPQQPVTSISSGQNGVYATALIHDLLKGEKVVVSWRTSGAGTAVSGPEVATSQVEVPADTDQRWFAFPLTTTLQPGDYAVWISVNKVVLNSLVFHVNG